MTAVFQTFVALGGNVPPQLAVSRELVRRGHEVVVLAHQSAREQVVATGAEFVPYRHALPGLDISQPETDPVRDWEARTPLGAGLRARDRAVIGPLVDATRECADLLRERPSDVVVLDYLVPGAAVAAEAAGLPGIALIHSPYPFPVDGAPPLFTGLRPRTGALAGARDRLLGRLITRFAAAGLPALNRARTEHGLAPLAAWPDQLLGLEALLVLTAPELDFASRGALPPNVLYVGPAFDPVDAAWHPPWPEANREPLVVVSFSSTYMDQGGLVQGVLDALAGLRVRVLLTTGPAIDVADLRLGANTRAVAFAPHRAVFPHAELVVTHAGWGTVNAALAAGVPLVCIPDARDQPDNAARVVAVGAGVRVRKRATPEKLRAVIAAALANPALERAAKAMARALGRSDGAAAAADHVERVG